MVSVILIVDNYGNFNGISFVYSVRGFLVMIAMVSVMLVVMIKMTESLWTGRREYVRNLKINTWLLITFTFSLSAHQFPLSTCLPFITGNFQFLKACSSLSLFPLAVTFLLCQTDQWADCQCPSLSLFICQHTTYLPQALLNTRQESLQYHLRTINIPFPNLFIIVLEIMSNYGSKVSPLSQKK